LTQSDNYRRISEAHMLSQVKVHISRPGNSECRL